MTPRIIFAALFLAATLGASDSPAQRLRVAVVQMAQAPTIAGNRDRIVAGIADAAQRGATVNVVDSSIWDDLRGLEERRAPIGDVQPESGVVEVYSQYSANLVACARSTDELLVVTRPVNAANLYHSRVIFRKNPQLEAWYRIGAASLQPKVLESQNKMTRDHPPPGVPTGSVP